MRVLCVNDEALDRRTGTEVYVSRLVSALRAAGDDVDVFAGEIGGSIHAFSVKTQTP